MKEQKKINRAQFLKLSGSSFLLLAGSTMIPMACFGGGIVRENSILKDPAHNPDFSGLPILGVLNTGITAPNPHNTQAWKFKILNEKEALLYVDENRVLSETDPTTRQIHIGQGTFLEHCRLGAQSLGYDIEINILPEGEYKISDIGKYPTAYIGLKKQSKVESVSHLYNAIALRATNRTAYQGRWLSENDFQNIVQSVNPRFSAFHYIAEQSAKQEHFPLLKNGFIVEMKTRAKNEESRKWFRLSDADIQTKRDGITLQGNGISGLKLFLARSFFFSLDPKVYHSDESSGYAIENFGNALDSSAGLVYIKTKDNRMKNWIECGMDYAKFQLELTSRSMVMQPMSQVLQEYVENEEIAAAYRELVQTKGSEKVQMIMRVGKSDYFFKSPRRDVHSMISGNLLKKDI